MGVILEKTDSAILRIAATKPGGKVARLLVERDIAVDAIEEDEGNVDRYVVSKRLAIERRTGSMFIKGIMEKTLFTSAVYLREHFEIPILIVEGQVNYEYSMMHPQAVRGALNSMMLVYGVNVLATPNIEETVEQIAMMTRQEQVGIPEISLVPKRKATSVPDMQRRIVEMLPGCGMVMARDLLQRFGSVKRVVNATASDFRGMKGIGKKKADQIDEVLNAEYEAVDTERDLEDAIQAEPTLLLPKTAKLVARQHYLCTIDGERQFVDMVFHDPKANLLILVELKRGRLSHEARDQLRGYMDNAERSKTLASLLGKGAQLRGVLATVEDCEYDSKADDIGVKIVDRKRVIETLVRLRQERTKD